MSFDVAVIGGGIMGCMTALTLADGGMKVLLVEQFGLGSGASGVNAGTLSLQIKRTSLMAYAMRGADLWETMSERLQFDVHHRRSGGLNLAFTDDEAERLTRAMDERRAAGLPIDFLSGAEARQLEPHLTDRIVLASRSRLDGFASANITGQAFRQALVSRGVEVVEFTSSRSISPNDSGYDLCFGERRAQASRIVLATGAWSRSMLNLLDLDAPIDRRVNQMSVTERTARLLNGVVGHISGLMSLKQADNGTILIGGGWQGEGAPGEPGVAIPNNLRDNLRFAQTALPAVAHLRLVRTWYGYDSFVPDFMPMVGELPGRPGAYIICCVRGGYTIGPCMGELLAMRMLGQEPYLPIDGFDPSRYVRPLTERSEPVNVA